MSKACIVKWLSGGLGIVLLALSLSVQAQKFSGNSPITLIVPYPPGGLTDLLGRVLAPKLGELLGTTVVVDNRPGANGSIGAGIVARAKPDGHVLCLVPASTVTTNQWLYKEMSYDPIKDLTPLAIAVITPNVLVVNPSVPAKNLPELLELIRSNPGKFNYASSGSGSSFHLQAEMMSKMAKLQMVHVPYKGSGPSAQALLAGDVQMMFDSLTSVISQIRAGKLRAIGVTSANPAAQAPEIPPLNQFLPGFESTPWFGLVGPAGMPKELVTQLNEAIVRATKSPEVTKVIEARGGQIFTTTADEMAKIIADESEQVRELIKSAKIPLLQ